MHLRGILLIIVDGVITGMNNKEYMNYIDYREDIEIDILDLLYAILTKWRVMIIWMLLGALLAGTFSYVKSSKAAKAVPADPEVELEALRSKLSEGDALVVEETAEQYATYYKKLLKLKDYAENSPFMQLDPTSVPTMVSLYAIDDHADGQVLTFNETTNETGTSKDSEVNLLNSKAESIVGIYRSKVADDKIIKDAARRLGSDVKADYLADMISAEYRGEAVLAVNVFGTNKEMCQAITDAVNAHMDEITEEVKKAYEFDITYTGTSYLYTKNDLVQTYQRNLNNDMYSLRANMDNISYRFTDDKKAYFEALASRNAETVVIGEASNTDAVKENMTVSGNGKGHVSKKYLLLGFVLGAFLVACWYGFKYVISGKLHTADDIRDAFHVLVIGEVNTTEKKNPIDKLLDKIFKIDTGDTENKMDVISSNIGISAKKASAKNVLIIGASSDDESVKFREGLKEKTASKNKEISFDIAESVLSNSHSVNKLSETDMVVFVERKDKSKFEHIMREMELCNEFGVEVIGAVVLV